MRRPAAGYDDPDGFRRGRECGAREAQKRGRERQRAGREPLRTRKQRVLRARARGISCDREARGGASVHGERASGDRTGAYRDRRCGKATSIQPDGGREKVSGKGERVSFREFKGNKETVTRMREMLQRDRFPHAVILSGPAGSGKYTLAQMLA